MLELDQGFWQNAIIYGLFLVNDMQNPSKVAILGFWFHKMRNVLKRGGGDYACRQLGQGHILFYGCMFSISSVMYDNKKYNKVFLPIHKLR